MLSQILVIDTEEFSRMQISWQVFFENSVDRFWTTVPTLKNDFFDVVLFVKILLIYLWIASNLKTGLSKKYLWKILFMDSKMSATNIIHLKVH